MVRSSAAEADSFLRLILDHVPALVWATDAQLRLIHHRGRDDLDALGLGTVGATGVRSLHDRVQADGRDLSLLDAHVRALAGEPAQTELRWRDRVLRAYVEPSLGPDASIVGCIGFAVDVTHERAAAATRDRLLVEEQRARVDAEIANARLLVLVEGSRRISRTMRPGDTLDALAAAVVPSLADWSYVLHRGWNDGPSLTAFAHGDPNKLPILRKLVGCRPAPDATEGAPRAFRTGEVAHYQDITPEQLTPPAVAPVGTRDPEHLAILRELGMRSLLCVPIRGRVGTDAVLILVSASDPRRFDSNDIVLAQDLALRAAVALEQARLLAEALESVRVRDEFLAVAAHELRTPLTSLLLRLQVLARALDRGCRPEAAASHAGAVSVGVRVAEANARHLAALVDRLLDVSRLTAHQIAVTSEETDLVQSLRKVVATLAPELQVAACAVEITAPPRVTGMWDRPRVEQVLTNLLANAMKFGAGRPIEVTIEATPELAILRVRDHGVGIPAEEQARIFGRFERAVSARHFGGLGLGLYLSSQIVRAHQGTLRVESELGQGACFIVELPRDPRAIRQPLGLSRRHD